jgi:Helix-turn-helix domain
MLAKSAPSSVPSSDFLSDYFEEQEFAAVLDRDVRTVRRWHSKRTGPPRVRVGRKILYKKSSVARWLEQNETHTLSSNKTRGNGR